jgi:hypothetical protein
MLEQQRRFVFALGGEAADALNAVFDDMGDGVRHLARFAAFGFLDRNTVRGFIGPFEQGFVGVIFEDVPKHPDLLSENVSGGDGGEGFEKFFHKEGNNTEITEKAQRFTE